MILFWHVAVSSAEIIGGGVSPGFEAELGSFGGPVTAMWISVWFFFVLSGYLISGPFVRAIVRGDGRRPSAARYARNRVLRILPGYYLWLAVTVIVVGGASASEILRFATFTHVYDQGPFTDRFVQAWTLDVEVVFYALVPLLALPLAGLLRGRLTPWGRAGLILAGLAAISAPSMYMGVLGPANGDILPGSAWAFAPGIALATVEPLIRDRFAGTRWGVGVAWGLIAVAVGAFLVHSYVAMSPRMQLLVAATACGALLAGPLVLQWTTGGAWRLLDLKPLHWLGLRSYGVYLSHVLIIYELRFVTEDLSGVPAALAVTFPLTLLAAAVLGGLSFRFVELPFLEQRVPWRSNAATATEETGEPATSPAPSIAGSAAGK